MIKPRSALLLAVVLTCAALGCDRPAAGAAGSAAAAKVTRIVFVGKEGACDCTRKSIDASWAALEKALGTPAPLPVEKLAIDTQRDQVEPYRKQRPVMALPGIYFVDAAGTVIELLQGEVTTDQISAVLRK